MRHLLPLLLLVTCLPLASASTIVRFDTTLGNIDVRLFDTATPASVANFLNYVVDDDYDGSFFHRAPKQFRRDDEGNIVEDEFGDPIVDTFVLQGGGFTYSAADELGNVPTDPPVINEPGISNTLNTLAYAKLGGDPNSATSGFFFNTVDNSENLDNQNGGFTVFGRVVRGFAALEAITELDIFDLDGAGQTFDTVPLLNSTDPLEDVLVFVNDVTVLDIPQGDYNLDGSVTIADYIFWRDRVGSLNNARPDGNGDGKIDLADYTIWRDAYAAAQAAAGLAPGTIPEPASAMLLFLAAGLTPRRRR